MSPAPARLLLLFALLVPLTARAADGQGDALFTGSFVLSDRTELARRTLSPLNALRQREQVAHGPAIDPAREKFTLHVPAEAPPRGYALMVYVSPWPGATVPSGWGPILDRHGMIFVSAANAGNDAQTFERREPLALLAARNVMARYPIDPQRVFVGGFSGGSRVAERLALAYPDLFRGALLDAGSDPIGDALPPPPADLFRRFQEGARLVYLTGEHDDFHLNGDRLSQRSMRAWCVFGIDAETMAWTGHDQADPASLDRALDALVKPTQVDPDRLALCRARLDQEMTAKFHEIEDLRAGGKLDDAWAQLAKLDAHYGGLAAARTLELAARLAGSR